MSTTITGTTKLYHVGQRVQLHPATDSWMRGDRYGEVKRVTAKYYHVAMDRSGRMLRIPECYILESV